MTINSVSRNISIDIDGGSDGRPGLPSDIRTITIKNRGDKTARVELRIEPEPGSPKSEQLYRWRVFSSLSPITVKSREDVKVTLRFDIPRNAEPGFYSYNICAQSPDYPGEMIQRAQSLRVLPSQDSFARIEPDFILDPPVDSEKPFIFDPEKGIIAHQVRVHVKNRLDRADRFFLKCPELDSKWYTIQPESALFEGLPLNPGEESDFIVLLCPPKHTPAGHYSSTLRLISHEQNDLVLLDIIYLRIELDDRIVVDLQPVSRKFPSVDPSFKLNVHNLGNVPREIKFDVNDEDNLFAYSVGRLHTLSTGQTVNEDEQTSQYFEPIDSLLIVPGGRDALTILPRVRRKRKRSWRGKGREVNFNVALENLGNEELALPEPQQGTILWLPYPSLLRWLLILSLAGLVLTAIASVAYWLVWKLIVQPSLQPKISEFSTTAESYKANGSNPIRLNWQIQNSNRMDYAAVTYYLPIGSQPSQDEDKLLEPVIIESQPSQDEDKPSQNEDKPLEVIFSRNQLMRESSCKEVDYQRSNLIQSLLWLYRNTYDEAKTSYAEAKTIICNGLFAQALTDETASNSTESANPTKELSTIGLKPGDYTVQLDVYKPPSPTLGTVTTGLGAPFSSQTVEIQITPADPSEILYFFSKVPAYRQIDPASPSPVATDARTTEKESTGNASEGQNATSPQPIPSPVDLPSVPIQLNWVISNRSQIRRLELSYIGVAADGSIIQSDHNQVISYDMTNGIPAELESVCNSSEDAQTDPQGTSQNNDKLPEDDRLICQDVSVPEVEIPGKYTFTLTVVMEEQPTSRVTKNSEPVEIRPLLPQIQSFKVNGQDVERVPQLVYLINPARGPIDVVFEWQVRDRNRMTVELLPTPGLINPQPESVNEPEHIMYLLSPTPGRTTFMLQVTNQAGEKVSRTVTIETAEYVASPQPAASPATPLPPNVGVPSSPTSPGELPLYEFPPRPN
ncbi:MAG: hypothetical protein NW224_12360 [Leptolyngbyaceae cyanobacterium bins.302]|nr:hypothetical protein [Leptolyngbyaceae cyanobacterium bins.302]